MKSRIIASVLFTAWLLSPCFISCTPNNPDEPGQPSDGWVAPTPGEYTFVCPEGHPWKPGDKINVRGSYAPASMDVTLEAGNISADGKTAKVNLSGRLFEFPARPDGLYAAFPSDKIYYDGDLTGETVQFLNPDYEIFAAYLNEGVFSFKPFTSTLTLSIDGDYDCFYLTGAGKEDLVFKSCEITCSTNDEGVLRPTKGSKAEIEGALEGGKITLHFPGITTFKSGFIFYFGKGGNYSVMYRHAGNEKIVRGQTLDLGNITSSLVAFDGYIPRVPSLGKPTKIDVNVQELSGICLTEDGEALWAVGDEGQLAKVSFDGKVQNIKHFSTDLEGVTRNPKTGDLLVCIEGSQRVAKISQPNFTERTNLFVVQEAVDGNFGNSGLEGITYYKDDIIYTGSQAGPYLWKYTLAGEKLEKINLKDITSIIREIADLCYDPVNDWLWVVDSESHKIFVFTGDAHQLIDRIELPTIQNEESVCVDYAHNCVWVGDDNDDQPAIYRYEFVE